MSLTVPGEPVPKARPRLNRRNGNFYTPRTTVAYEDAVAWQATASRLRLDGDVAVTLRFYCKRLGDLDNRVKAVLDGLQKGGAFDDDRQVRRIVAEAFPVDAEGARTEIEVCALRGSAGGVGTTPGGAASLGARQASPSRGPAG